MEVEWISPTKFGVNFSHNNMPYSYDGPCVSSKDNTVSCPYCGTTHSLMSATDAGSFLRIYGHSSNAEVANNSDLFNELKDIVNEGLAKLELEKMKASQGCERCIAIDH